MWCIDQAQKHIKPVTFHFRFRNCSSSSLAQCQSTRTQGQSVAYICAVIILTVFVDSRRHAPVAKKSRTLTTMLYMHIMLRYSCFKDSLLVSLCCKHLVLSLEVRFAYVKQPPSASFFGQETERQIASPPRPKLPGIVHVGGEGVRTTSP